MNTLDKKYTDLLQDILDNGVKKNDRTGTGTLSVFGREIRHKMSEGFPLLTTKKMYFSGIATELIWFLRGDTNIRYLVDNNCNIWNGDAYKNYLKNFVPPTCPPSLDVQPDFYEPMSMEMFIKSIQEKNSRGDEFAKKWGNLGPIYGKQWRFWEVKNKINAETGEFFIGNQFIDQIDVLIKTLKTNPDSRRLLVNAWNIGEVEQMVLPPCHYGFECWSRELTLEERAKLLSDKVGYTIKETLLHGIDQFEKEVTTDANAFGIPTRALSLKWIQRSCDFPLGIPYNIASYGLLLLMLAKQVNMVPDELIGSLGDCHIYLNQIDGCKEQIGRDLTYGERFKILENKVGPLGLNHDRIEDEVNQSTPKRTREPFDLPTVSISNRVLSDISEYVKEDIVLENYISHEKINFPLSN
jgi:thymidylate synthase